MPRCETPRASTHIQIADGLYFFYCDTMHLKHQLAFDDIFRSAKPFRVLDDCFSGVVVDIYKVGFVADGPFRYPVAIDLRRDKDVGHLFAEVRYDAGALHQLQLIGPVVLLSGVVAAGLFSVILVFLFAGARLLTLRKGAEFVNCHRCCRPLRNQRG